MPKNTDVKNPQFGQTTIRGNECDSISALLQDQLQIILKLFSFTHQFDLKMTL